MLGVLDRMYLPEPLTLTVAMVLVILLTSANYLVIWFQNRRQVALLWMLGASLLSSLCFAFRLLLPDRPGAVLGTAAILITLGCIWTGCRTAAGRRPWLPALVIPTAIWLPICAIPGFFTPPSARFAVPFLMAAPMLASALGELWPAGSASGAGPRRRLARWCVTALLGVQIVICLGWGIAQVLSMVRDLGIGSETVDLPVSAFILTGFNLIMSFAFVALIKEQSDWEFWQTAQQDPLTGLGNRRRLDSLLDTAVSAARRSAAPLAVLMIDVDHFKAYNDHYGHLAGDACLRAIAQALRGGLIRRGDEVLRYGGEEFAVILQATREAEAMAVAERLRMAVRAMDLPHAAQEGGIVTISLGVAVMEPGRTGERRIVDARTLIDAADRALYQAKDGGRDRIAAFAEASAAPASAVLPAPALRLDPA
jgi:diguanylate cyclase (GGDEF)-like protein